MAKVIVNIHIEEAQTPQQAVEVAHECIAMLQSRLRGTPHIVEGSVQVPCPACSTNLTVRGGELICVTCENSPEEQAWRDFVYQATHPQAKRHKEPTQVLEALLM